MLKEGDYVPDGEGGLRRVAGGEELLQRVVFKLTARRGKFPLLPELGSRLYLLTREKPGRRRALAEQYVAEALADEPDLLVTGVTLDEARQRLHVTLVWQGKDLAAAVALP